MENYLNTDYGKIEADGLTAQLDGNYSEGIMVFNKLISKYPNEGSAIIRKMYLVYVSGERIKSSEQLLKYISDLDSAEKLIKSGVSKYAMDKHRGLQSLYFLRGYFKSILAGSIKDYLPKALDDIEKSLALDPNYQLAKNLKIKLINGLNSPELKSDGKTIFHDNDNNKNKSNSGCFIATAVYGSPYSSEVIILKEFRDNWLLNYQLGKVVVHIYYWVSPPIAKQIAKRKFLQEITKSILIIPIIKYAKYLKRKVN